MKKYLSSPTRRPRSADSHDQPPAPGHSRAKSSPNPAVFTQSPHQRRKKRDPELISTPVAVQKKYAGAVFQSSPAPCTLPTPNFSRSVPQKSSPLEKPDIRMPSSLSDLRESPLGRRIRQPVFTSTTKSLGPRHVTERPPSRSLSESSSPSSTSESADLTFLMDPVDETPTRRNPPRLKEYRPRPDKSLELDSRSKALLAILCEQPIYHRERPPASPYTPSTNCMYYTLATRRPPAIKHLPLPVTNFETTLLQVHLKQILNIA